MASNRLAGVMAPVVMPYDEALAPDRVRYVAHCRWLLSAGCTGLAVFGTNSEANSLSVEERMTALEALLEAGIDPGVLMPGTGCCALTDTVRLTSHAVSRGCAGVLMLPPFYYKAVSDEGLFASFAEVIERVGDARLRIYLYHIPPIAQVGFSHGLVERLFKAYPGVVVGMKDSSGDWANTRDMIESFPGFDVFSGSEHHLLRNLRAGGVGCITAIANVRPGPIRALYDSWQGPDADRRQAAISATRKIIEAHPTISAMKAIIGHYRGQPSWGRVRPPLVALGAAQLEQLIAALEGQDFEMPGLAA